MIKPGEVLDKYELLERVGQGGMAVVYRGLDRSLKRTVAIKVLHRHLADSKEARDRFEREAHAVAKLRHENILEIFAYAGSDSDESYIVTEFIEGMTLKQFVTDHPLPFPEIGAMIVLQIGRALVHAHGAGILHRDVKPENVMIRSDGVVKLTDFGISQMVDLNRLTVTGQLLGSPAYMSPEHVEGQPLDFRTDVFACGIVLYQLTVGKLPFEGKNPHEILKRIADCKFPDPRMEHPRIGNELGKIILRAMERRPEDRYPSIGEFVAALERYLTASGLGPASAELGRFFGAPGSYEVALQQRLVDHLSRRGRELLATDQAQGLQALDRVLTLDPAHEPTLKALATLNQRRRVKHLVVGVLGSIALVGLIIFARSMLSTPADDPADPLPIVALTPPIDARVAVPMVMDARRAVRADAVPADGPVSPTDDATPAIVADPRPDRDAPRTVDAQPTTAVSSTTNVTVSPTNSEVQIDGGAWQVWPGGRGTVAFAAGVDSVRVTVRNGTKFQSDSRVIRRADAGKRVTMQLSYLPAQVIPRCALPGVQVKIDGRMARLNMAKPIFFDDTIQTTKTVHVEFVGERIDAQSVSVSAATTLEVTCALR